MIKFKGIEFPPDFAGNVQRAFATRQNALDAKAIALMEDYVPIAQPRFRNRGKMSKSHRQEKPGVIITPNRKPAVNITSTKAIPAACAASNG